MRCRVGDLAVYVGTSRAHIGKVVRCVRLADEMEFSFRYRDGKPAWDVEPDLLGNNTAVYDEALRPIRDQPGEDETITWAGKPVTTKRLTEQEFDTITSVWSKS